MVDYIPRSVSRLRPARGSTALVTSQVEGNALHWPGMARPINAVGDAGMARVASALRGWQNYHMDERDWSDIAYQIAVDQEGRAWTLRGLNIRSGANGNGDVNRRFGAILLILAPGEQPSSKMKATVGAVMMDFRARFPKCPRRPVGHRDVRPDGTTCPGPMTYSAIKSGLFDARVASVPLPPVDPRDKRPRNDKGQLCLSYKAIIAGLDGEVSDWYEANIDSCMATLRHLGFGESATLPYSHTEFRTTWYTFQAAIDASSIAIAFEWLVDAAGFWPPDVNDWPANARDR